MLKQNWLFIFFVICSIFFLVGGSASRANKANIISKTLFYPFVHSLNNYYEFLELKENNQELVKKLAIMQIKNVKLHNKLDTYANLEIEYDVLNSKFILANIIAYTGNFQEKTLVLDKGKKQGVKLDNPIISSNGIVGKINLVADNYSICLPLDNSNFKLSVMLKRNSLQGLLTSDIYGNIAMTMIRQGSDIVVGDTLITSDLSTVFPRGYDVGVVKSIQIDSDGINMKANIKPFTVIDQLDQIVIIEYKKDMSYETEINQNR